jgi:hypothetical protein
MIGRRTTMINMCSSCVHLTNNNKWRKIEA